MVTDELRVIPRLDGGPPIEASVEDRPDGTRVLRHELPGGTTLETFLKGSEVTVFQDGKLILDVGPMVLDVEEEEEE